MPTTPTPYEESPRTALPVPVPTHPVAGQQVETDTPSFDWTPVPEAARYRLQISASENFEPILYDEVVERKTTIPLAPLFPDGATAGYWRVRAEIGDETTAWSSRAHFVLSSAEPEEGGEVVYVDAPPVPLRPAEDTPIDRRATPFTWKPVPEASGYQLQVAPSKEFKAPVVDLTVDQTTSVTLCEMLPEDAPLHWRIRSLFQTNTPGPWSPPLQFTTASSADEDPVPDVAAPDEHPPEASPTASGPVQRARTPRSHSVVLILLMILSFLVTLALIAQFG